MHRTIASAALITTAVVGLAGCVTVSPSSGPEESGEPQIVQAPAREALESLEHAGRSTPRARRSPPPKGSAHRETVPRPAQPYVPLPRLPIPQPAVRPAAPPPQLPRHPDACELGRDFDQYQSEGGKVHLC